LAPLLTARLLTRLEGRNQPLGQGALGVFKLFHHIFGDASGSQTIPQDEAVVAFTNTGPPTPSVDVFARVAGRSALTIKDTKLALTAKVIAL
jgi:hypothetical protein